MVRSLFLLVLIFTCGCGETDLNESSQSYPSARSKGPSSAEKTKQTASKVKKPTKVEHLLKVALEKYKAEMESFESATKRREEISNHLAELQSEKTELEKSKPAIPKTRETLWMSKKGSSSVRGTMVGLSSDSKVVHIKKENGKIAKVPLAKLKEYNTTHVKDHQDAFRKYNQDLEKWTKEVARLEKDINTSKADLLLAKIPSKPVEPTNQTILARIRKESDEELERWQEAFREGVTQIKERIEGGEEPGQFSGIRYKGSTVFITVTNDWYFKTDLEKKQDLQAFSAVWLNAVPKNFQLIATVKIVDKNENVLGSRSGLSHIKVFRH